MIALALNRYSFDKTAKATGISKSTLKRWAKLEPKKEVSGLLDRAIEQLLMNIPKAMTGQEWAIALGILLDKYLIMRGEPIMRTESTHRQISSLTDDEFDNVLEEASRILHERTGSSLPPGDDGSTGGAGAPSAD